MSECERMSGRYVAYLCEEKGIGKEECIARGDDHVVCMRPHKERRWQLRARVRASGVRAGRSGCEQLQADLRARSLVVDLVAQQHLHRPVVSHRPVVASRFLADAGVVVGCDELEGRDAPP